MARTSVRSEETFLNHAALGSLYVRVSVRREDSDLMVIRMGMAPALMKKNFSGQS